MLASHIIRLKTFVYSRKAAVDSAFIRPLYRGSIGVAYRVFFIAMFYIFTVSF